MDSKETIDTVGAVNHMTRGEAAQTLERDGGVMYIGTSVATEEQYAKFLALNAGNNPLLQVRPTWVDW
jgi:hypothetical protein